jgi:hypothetical protein
MAPISRIPIGSAAGLRNVVGSFLASFSIMQVCSEWHRGRPSVPFLFFFFPFSDSPCLRDIVFGKLGSH